jgi:hypothetical protein
MKKGIIRFEDEILANMASWDDIHTIFLMPDDRILPYDLCVEEELRPYQDHAGLSFKMRDPNDAPDTLTANGGGASGTNNKGEILPEVIFPQSPIDTTGGTKVHGALKGSQGNGSDSYTDSVDDEENQDDYKLKQIGHAVRLGQPLTVILQGSYQFSGREKEVQFRHPYEEKSAPKTIYNPLLQTIRHFEVLCHTFGADLPRPCYWFKANPTRKDLAISVTKMGKGLHIQYSMKNLIFEPIADFPSAFNAEFPGNWSIVFGASATPADQELSERLAMITPSWREDSQDYSLPWQARLSAHPWCTGEQGEVYAEMVVAHQAWDGGACQGEVTYCAYNHPTFSEPSRPKETTSLFEFVRDAMWPVKLSLATYLDEHASLMITYSVDWTGCDCTHDWAWARRAHEASQDQIDKPPAFSRPDTKSAPISRKENNGFHIIFREIMADGSILNIPDDPGIPVIVLFAPRAEIRLRRQSTSIADTLPIFSERIRSLHDGRFTLQEQVRSTGWIAVGSLGNEDERGQIPPEYRLVSSPAVVPVAPAFNTQLKKADLRTQNHDKGLDRFIRYYDESKCLAAIIALAEGKHQDRAYAVYFVQEQRLCLLLDSMHGYSDVEVFWTTMAKWANFRPNPVKHRDDRGRLFFPSEATHIIQEYWDLPTSLDQHRLFSQESPYVQQRMSPFSSGLFPCPAMLTATYGLMSMLPRKS